jgi:hypothetical protein
MFNGYDKKMINIYFKKIKECIRLFKWNMWQKINRRFLKTYLLIEDCARCEECGINVHDFHVPDDIWIKVYGNESGVLCYDCFCDKADKKFEFKWRLKGE